MKRIDEIRDDLINAALRLLSSERYSERHPEDPFSDAEIEMWQDALDDAARKYVKQLDERKDNG